MSLIEDSQQMKFAKAKGGTLDKVEHMMMLPNLVMEKKYDGCRYRMVIDGDEVILQSRRLSKKTGKWVEKTDRVPHLIKDIGNFGGTVIEGEIVSSLTGTSSDVVSIMGCSAEKAVARQEENGNLRWVCFDILFHAGRDLRNLQEHVRRKILEDLLIAHSYNSYAVRDYWSISERYKGNLIDKYHELIRLGYEGGMIKDVTAPYGKGWFKCKEVIDLDVVCTGFTDAEPGKYAGQIGAIEFGVLTDGYIRKVSQAGGMKDEMRKWMTANKKLIIGEPITIYAQEITKTKEGWYSCRHPRFIRMRPDIGVADCTLEKFLEQGKMDVSNTVPK